ncbi:unnamed protein product [Caenorhabditis angaria]|uniref:Uncharacterized protein n=1 Tax=Caenorhabditis angaria TaxID=860376 RepID=A0A9P1NA61_9PELO|nr:unnamed protein product [Caenorhabditis angaria]
MCFDDDLFYLNSNKFRRREIAEGFRAFQLPAYEENTAKEIGCWIEILSLKQIIQMRFMNTMLKRIDQNVIYHRNEIVSLRIAIANSESGISGTDYEFVCRTYKMFTEHLHFPGTEQFPKLNSHHDFGNIGQIFEFMTSA